MAIIKICDYKASRWNPKCSRCGHSFAQKSRTEIFGTKFCPNCGAEITDFTYENVPYNEIPRGLRNHLIGYTDAEYFSIKWRDEWEKLKIKYNEIQSIFAIYPKNVSECSSFVTNESIIMFVRANDEKSAMKALKNYLRCNAKVNELFLAFPIPNERYLSILKKHNIKTI